MSERKPGKSRVVTEDIEFARRVLSGDAPACREFVERYTDWVLYKILELMKSHCNYTARECVCTLLVLQKKRKGDPSFQPSGLQCDECMDSYVWMFDYLKKRLGAYRGTRNCSLDTYVWSILNSRTTYIDWLRWRYGRAF